MLTADRKVPSMVWSMLLANLVLLIASFCSPVQMWTASCSVSASATVIGVATSFRKNPEDVLPRAGMVTLFGLFAAFALCPFLAYFD
ncbi:MAG: hypothetical protein HUU46_16540 [Candidatus Hydrogenedentes bacterium]|nr:hypothetical protein [Candidatus Hydrogenedentota bacterium]